MEKREKSQSKMDNFGVPLFQEPPISLNKRVANYTHKQWSHGYNYSVVSSFTQKIEIPPFSEIRPDVAKKQPKTKVNAI